MTTRNLQLPELTAQQQEKFLSINESSHIIDAMVLPVVEGITNIVPTVTSADIGRKWIVGTAPVSGSAWGGQANQIAIRITDGVNESWKFITPPVGLVLYLASNNFARYRFSGVTWSEAVNDAIPQSLLDRVEESIAVKDFQEGGTKTIFDTCRVDGADTTPNNVNVDFAVSLTCIGNVPNTGTGVLDGVLTLRSDTNFTWGGVAVSDDFRNPRFLTATRAPNDGANDAMVQRWIVEGALMDFAREGIIAISNQIGDTNFSASFQGTVRFNEREVPDGGRAIAPVNLLIGEYLEDNSVGGVSASDIEVTGLPETRTPVSSLPVYPAGDTPQSTWQIRNLSFPAIPTGGESYSLEFVGQTTADDASGFVWALFYTDQNLSVADLSAIAGQQISGTLTDPRIIAGEEFPFGSGSDVHWTTPELQTIPNIDPTRALSLYVGNYTGTQQVTINSMEIVGASSTIEGVLVPGARTIADEQIANSSAIAKIPAIETKSNANETAISGLQTTTGELTTAQGATRTIADNNATEIAAIKALIPTDGISGVGDLTALEEDIEANQGRITAAETKNMEQDTTLTELATKNTQQDEAIALNTAKIGTTPTERTRIATIPALTNRVTANDAKPTNDEVDTRADNRIDAQLESGGSIFAYVAANGGTTQTEKTAIAKIPAIETKSNANETAISGLQTTTGELTTAQGATRTIADNNATEIATIKALIPTDGISGVGDLTALEEDVEANQLRITAAETKNMEQDTTLTELATKNTQQDEAIALNTAKPTNAQVDTRADNRIDASLEEGGAVATYVSENAGTEGALVLEDLALETTERLCGVSGADTTPSDSFNIATLTLECDGETPTEGAASLGGVIRFTANSAWNGKFRVWDGKNNLGTATQISGGNTGAQEWRIDDIEWLFTNTGERLLIFDNTAGSVFTPSVDGELTFTFEGELTRGEPAGQAVASVEAIAEKSIVDSLAEGGAVATYVADNAGSGGGGSGVSLEAVANEMRADGDEATIPAETLPDSAQITATAEAQTDITVPDNALFRSFSTINASFSSSIVNAGNSINVGIRYTDDDTIPPTGGLRPSFTNSTIRNFTGVDLTRPIAFFFGVGEMQDISVGDLSFTNTKTGTGSLVDEMQTIVLNQVAGDITLGGDPIMGGGVRYRTFFNDIPASSLIGGSTQNFTIPSGLDAEVTYLTWAALVLTASTTASNATLWGGDSGASANDRGAVSLNLQQRGSNGEHSFGIARQTHGAAVRISSITATPSSETMIRVSITVRQGGELKLPIA